MVNEWGEAAPFVDSDVAMGGEYPISLAGLRKVGMSNLHCLAHVYSHRALFGGKKCQNF